ncbi:hypothetical protein ZIOFF_021559 [Zingiber officinale]|uniref:RING-type E3 ubiquitin transferase n=2 Tax=Zingiber officinale TaxID=94328 RepID=A0A8J5HBY3_ZINOF|nr:hypothetical protein ZIOFF_021559 [Zingiber officinale]
MTICTALDGPSCKNYFYYIFAVAVVGFFSCICCMIIKQRCFRSNQAASSRQPRTIPLRGEPHTDPESLSQPSRGGLASAVIRSMPSFQYNEHIRDECGREINECAICLFQFREEEYLRRLPNCEHVFHVSCSDTWLQMNSTCPLCRTNVLYDVEYVASVTMTTQMEPERSLGYHSLDLARTLPVRGACVSFTTKKRKEAPF